MSKVDGHGRGFPAGLRSGQKQTGLPVGRPVAKGIPGRLR
ncbi:hypothetical protein NY78_1673 [Desulfovibrio sp. TomC]|nr:hypothetical protein NY78_1673 [Desulfovibrio sp. TomC]